MYKIIALTEPNNHTDCVIHEYGLQQPIPTFVDAKITLFKQNRKPF